MANKDTKKMEGQRKAAHEVILSKIEWISHDMQDRVIGPLCIRILGQVLNEMIIPENKIQNVFEKLAYVLIGLFRPPAAPGPEVMINEIQIVLSKLKKNYADIVVKPEFEPYLEVKSEQ